MRGIFGGAALWAATLFACGGNAAETTSLDGAWRLDYWRQPVTGAVRALQIPAHETVTATVPGNCELDLVRAGILPEPEKGLNALRLRPYEGYQWLYTKTFPAKAVPPDGSRATLLFEGIDTLADVFLNGVKVGESENMLIERRFDVTRVLRDGENTVQVLLRSPAIEAQTKSVGELGHSMGILKTGDMEPFRKAGHMGGWDIMPRVYCAGLWRSVSLLREDPVRIDETAWLVTGIEATKAESLRLDIRCRVQAPFDRLDRSSIRFTVSKDGAVLRTETKPLQGYLVSHRFRDLKDVELWWPKGMGAQPLYDATVEVLDENGTALARHAEKIGFRSIRLEYDDNYGPDRPGQFLFRVNGEPCYVRGVNWTPLDAFHGRDREHLDATLALVGDLNCNMVRVWGGGVYEPDAFFDWCDRNGVMVWQDFMTACSVFPQDDAYAAATREEVLSVAKRLRNRASLAIWSGNNENDEIFEVWLPKELHRDPNLDRSSRRTIPEALFDYDITRPYLPSSPYTSPDVYAGKARPSEAHLWGKRGYYKTDFYTNSACWFASEMGYHGCPNLDSLRRMMTPEKLYPWTSVTGDDPLEDYHWNDEWLLKASDPLLSRSMGHRRNSLMTNQAKILFGTVPTNLAEFVEASQIVQAEAMKTFCELFRSRKFTRFNGLIWWNVRDGWPLVSDAVVDWYGGRKKAYFALKNAQRDQIVCMVDDGSVWAVNDVLRPVKGHARLRDRVSGRILLEREFVIPANGKVKLGDVALSGQGLVVIDATLDGRPFRNHFLYGKPPFSLSDVSLWLRETYDAVPDEVYLLIGQSNMAGRGKMADAPRISTDRVCKFGTNGTWEVATPPVHWDGGRGGFGPALPFGRAMADAKPGVTIGLVPCAVGGTSLSQWMPHNGACYTNALAKTRLALASGGRLKGVIWHQGEADSWNERTSGNYGKRIGILVRQLRKEFGDPNLPFVGGEVAPFYSVSIAKKGGTSFVSVVNAQERAALAALPATGYVTAEGLKHGDGGDIVHFEPSSAAELGRRYAAEMLRVQKEGNGHE